MLTGFDKAIAAALAPLVTSGLLWLGEQVGVPVPAEMLTWAQAAVVAAVAAVWVYFQSNKA